MLTDLKYIGIVSTRLSNFKRKESYLWNFRCPICGDSQSSKLKTRGYFYRVKDKINYKCHNCSASMGLVTFLKQVAPDLVQQYYYDKFKNNNDLSWKTATEEPVIPKEEDVKTVDFHELYKVSELKSEHKAKEYLSKRKIPVDWYERLYYVTDFRRWVNTIIPGKFTTFNDNEERIVIPCRDEKNRIVGFAGRSLNKVDERFKYITISLNSERKMVFGLDRIDFTKRIYVVEGQFDSMFIPNCLSAQGASGIFDIVEQLHSDGLDVVAILDNEPRNKEVLKIYEKIIKNNFNIVIWQSKDNFKDINDLILSGYSAEDVLELINTSTFSSMNATLKFNSFKKINL